MYGGNLFADLPISKKKNHASSSSSRGERTNDTSSSSSSHIGTTTNADQKQQKNSIVAAIGNAGTSMAFVPTALMRKPPKRSRNDNPNAIPETTTATTIERKQPQIEIPIIASDTIVMNNHNNHRGASSLLLEDASSHASDVNHHYPPNNNKEEANNNNINSSTEEKTTIMVVESAYVEPESLVKLHETAAQPSNAPLLYDPHVPNDYLLYKEQKQMEKIRLENQKSQKEALEMQRVIRERIEEERRMVESTGNIDKIIASRLHTNDTSGGSGRGRGLNNLPAWLVKKQQQQQQQNDSSSPLSTITVQQTDPLEHAIRTVNNDDDKESNERTVLLTNMVEPGNVDDDLADEVREECEDKCGRVLFVRVVEDHPEGVQVYVTFENREDAKEAARVFHGRRFGPRQISAKLL